jgi:uncharacterized protein (TIGR03905 family)
MASYSFNTRGVCARQVVFDLEDGTLKNVKFIGGCPGNTKAIAKLLEGADAKRTVDVLKGNDCGGRGTSCADQLTKAIEAALQKEAQI